MNPFKNQIVNLSASDAIKNKKDRHIYSAAKKQFEVKNFCKKQRNLRYYRNGKVRSVVNYEYGNDLARGNILCNNCDRPENTCGDVFKQNAQRIDMHTNEFSEFNGGGVVAPDISWNFANLNFNYIGVTQEQAFPVINSDISGSWRGSVTDISKADLSGAKLPGSDPSLNMPFGYVNNLIDIPRNLDGKGLIIDPSNELFPDSKCGAFNYLNNSFLKANIIMRGSIDLSMNIGLPQGIPFESGDSCKDPSYNQFIGKFAQLIVDTGFNPPIGTNPFTPTTGVFYGIVKQICCLNPLVGRAGSIPWMDIHIELNNISDLNILNTLIKYKPQFKGPNWSNTALAAELGPYAWGPLKLPWALLMYDSTSITTNPLNTVRSVTLQGFFSDINFYMGNCINNLTQTNAFRDTYMSCLEDGTKKINFTKHNPVDITSQSASIGSFTPPLPPLPPLSPPTDLSGTPSPTTAELSVLNFNEPAGANFPTVGVGQEVRYELFLNNQDPNLLPNPPNSIYALWGRQESSTGAGNPVSNISISPASAFRNVSANSSPSGKYYFMARTLLVDTTTPPNTTINTSPWVVSPAIDPAPYSDPSLNITTSPGFGITFAAGNAPLGFATNIDLDGAKDWIKNQNSVGSLTPLASFNDNFILKPTGDINPIKSWLWAGPLDPGAVPPGTIINGTLWWCSVELYNTPGDQTSGLTSDWTTGYPPPEPGQPANLFSYAGENPAPKVAPSFIS